MIFPSSTTRATDVAALWQRSGSRRRLWPGDWAVTWSSLTWIRNKPGRPRLRKAWPCGPGPIADSEAAWRHGSLAAAAAAVTAWVPPVPASHGHGPSHGGRPGPVPVPRPPEAASHCARRRLPAWQAQCRVTAGNLKPEAAGGPGPQAGPCRALPGLAELPALPGGPDYQWVAARRAGRAAPATGAQHCGRHSLRHWVVTSKV